ncbi:hypothetical protein D3C78_1190330 [compost metagenome]
MLGWEAISQRGRGWPGREGILPALQNQLVVAGHRESAQTAEEGPDPRKLFCKLFDSIVRRFTNPAFDAFVMDWQLLGGIALNRVFDRLPDGGEERAW